MYMHTVVLVKMNCHLQGNDETGNHIKLKKSDSNKHFLFNLVFIIQFFKGKALGRGMGTRVG